MEELLAKYFSGEATLDERSLVDSWKSESKENATAFFESKIIWSVSEKTNENHDHILAAILDEGESEKSLQRFMAFTPWLKYAAAAVLVFAIGLLFILNQPDTGYEVHSLADGSEITLHGASQIEVVRMDDQVREVKLTGKAYFDVERDEKRPFIIRTENSSVEVLGTSFLINTDAADTKVCVESGLVALIKKDTDLSVKLEKGEMGVVSSSNKGIIKKANDNPNYLAWKTKILSFKDSNISEVSSVLEDVYGIDVVIENQALANCKLTAKINKKKAKDAIEIIARTFNLDYSMKGKVVTLKGRGC